MISTRPCASWPVCQARSFGRGKFRSASGRSEKEMEKACGQSLSQPRRNGRQSLSPGADLLRAFDSGGGKENHQAAREIMGPRSFREPPHGYSLRVDRHRLVACWIIEILSPNPCIWNSLIMPRIPRKPKRRGVSVLIAEMLKSCEKVERERASK